MNLEEDLKKVIGPLRDDVEIQGSLRKMPPPTLEDVARQLRASKEFRARREDERRNIRSGSNEQQNH